MGQYDLPKVPRQYAPKRLRRRDPVVPSHPVFGRGPGIPPHAQHIFEPELQCTPNVGRRVGEVLDEVNKDQSAAGAVIHRNLAHDARPLHEHLVDFSHPVRGR